MSFRIKVAPPAAAKSAVAAAATGAPAAHPLTEVNGNYFFHRRLQHLCHNGRSFQRFSAANAEVLSRYLCHYFPQHADAIRLNKAPSLTAHAKTVSTGDAAAPSISQMLPPVHEQYFVARDYIETVLNAKLRPNAPPPCVLPLPEVTMLHQQVLDGTMTLKEVDDMLQPRELHHISSVVGYEHYDWSKYGIDATTSEITGKMAAAEATASNSADPLAAPHTYYDSSYARLTLGHPTSYSNGSHKVMLPRDALGGNFFQREELVDNLLAAARHFKYENPFWLRSTHPQLHKYLKLAAPSTSSGLSGGGATIGSSVDALAGGGMAVGGQDYNSFVSQVPCLSMSLSSVVFFLEDLQPRFPVQFLHPLLVPDPNSPHVAGKSLPTCYDLLTNAPKIKRGMNAATGFVSSNPYFTAGASEGTASQLQANSAHSSSGVWLSLDQVLRYGLTLKDGKMPTLLVDDVKSAAAAPAEEMAPVEKKKKKGKAEKAATTKEKGTTRKDGKGKKKDAAASVTTPETNPYSRRFQKWSGNGRLIEIEEWELYNAAQLAVPGRVALKQAAVDESDTEAASRLFK